jgi:putative MATE family efflux protein
MNTAAIPTVATTTIAGHRAPAAKPSHAAGRNAALLHGPIVAPMLRLGLPVLVVLAMQTGVSAVETWFVSFLGTDALAGVTLVFPLLMLMTMMSAGALGGAVAAAVARALGAGRVKDANALVMHALLLAVAFGLAFTAGALLFGRALYSTLGGEGATLANALLYSGLVFGAAVPIWITNLLSAALRGAGNVKVPALVTAGGALLTLVLSPLLIFGWGPLPGMGVAGAGAAMIIYYLIASAALVTYLRSPASPLRLALTRIESRLVKDILGVGLLSAFGTLLPNLTVAMTTGLVGSFGQAQIAAYGLGSRFDYMFIPVLFALGTATVTMVGTNVGAGQFARARRIAWTAAAISAVVPGTVGVIAAVFPNLWVGLFSQDPAVLTTGAAYLHRVAPFYVIYAFGMGLYFAGQGFGRVLGPVIAGSVRLVFVVAAGWVWVSLLHGDINGLFWIAAAGMVIYGLMITAMFSAAR